jgi:hypothetical protein
MESRGVPDQPDGRDARPSTEKNILVGPWCFVFTGENRLTENLTNSFRPVGQPESAFAALTL